MRVRFVRAASALLVLTGVGSLLLPDIGLLAWAVVPLLVVALREPGGRFEEGGWVAFTLGSVGLLGANLYLLLAYPFESGAARSVLVVSGAVWMFGLAVKGLAAGIRVGRPLAGLVVAGVFPLAWLASSAADKLAPGTFVSEGAPNGAAVLLGLGLLSLLKTRETNAGAPGPLAPPLDVP